LSKTRNLCTIVVRNYNVDVMQTKADKQEPHAVRQDGGNIMQHACIVILVIIHINIFPQNLEYFFGDNLATCTVNFPSF